MNSTENPPESESESNNTKNKQHLAKPQGVIAPQVAPTELQPEESNNSWYESVKSCLVSWGITPWRILEGLGIAAAIAYAIITFCQWQDLRHNFAIDERAWIKAKVLWPVQMTDDRIPVQVINVGKSVVDTTIMNADIEVVDRASPPSFDRSGWHSVSIFETLFPSDGDVVTVARYHRTEGGEFQLSDSEIKALTKGDSYAAVWGQINYRDQFGEHWTKFCEWKAFTDNMTQFTAASCTEYNSVGDGKPPDK